MNPFLLAFLGAITAFALIAAALYTLFQLKIAPYLQTIFEQTIDPSVRRGMQLAHDAHAGEAQLPARYQIDEAHIQDLSARIDRFAKLPQESSEQWQTRIRDYFQLQEIEQDHLVSILLAHIDLAGCEACPLCDVPFQATYASSGKVVHLCEDHGRACEGCPTVLRQFEAFAQKQGLGNMLPHEIAELERLRAVCAGAGGPQA